MTDKLDRVYTYEQELDTLLSKVNDAPCMTADEKGILHGRISLAISMMKEDGVEVPEKMYNWIDYLNGV